MAKKPSFGPNFGTFGPNSCHQIFFFKNLAASITRYHGQLSSCTILVKNNDPILKKRNDAPPDRWIDGRTDGREWFHRTLSD